jgi:hypothetical protein
VAQTLTASQRNIVRVQHWLLFPVLLLARLSWCMQSMTFPFNGKVSGKKAVPEVFTIAGHYAWLLSAAFTWLSPVKVRPSYRLPPARPYAQKMRRGSLARPCCVCTACCA